MPAIQTIKFRRGTASQWTSTNPVLSSGEMGIETDTNKFKFGNGTSTWSLLSYAVASSSGSATVEWSGVLNKAIDFTSGTASSFTTANNTLGLGVIGYETDTGKVKIGNGSTAWTSLKYVSDWATIQDRPMDFITDTSLNYIENNPTLPLGTFGYETDTGRFKIGDGATAWLSKKYAGGGGGDTATTFLLMGA